MKLLSGVHRYRRTLNTLNPLPSLASEKKYIREYIFVFATLYSRYVSYSSLVVFVPALVEINYVPVKLTHNQFSCEPFMFNI